MENPFDRVLLLLLRLAVGVQDAWMWVVGVWHRRRSDFLTAMLLALAVGADLWMERAAQAENCIPPQERSPISTPLREFIPTGRFIRSRYVAIVSLRPDKDPKIFEDPCQIKRYLASLIGRLDEDGPALIVVDEDIPTGDCTVDSLYLRLSIERSSGDWKIPVVLGRKTELLDYAERTNGEESSCLVVSKNWTSVVPDVPRGLMKLNRNVRRIPLKWSVFADREDVLHGKPIEEYGVAAVAADVFSGGSFGIVSPTDQFQRRRKPESSYAKLFTKSEHPFLGGGLLPQSRFYTSSASDILNGPGEDTRSNVRGRVVVVGDFSPSNIYQVGPDQEMAGPVLQANYIEALLDDRFYFPVSYGGFSLFYIIWLGIMQWAFWKSKSPERTGLIFLLLLVAVNLVVMHFHVFFGALKEGASAGAVVIKWLEARGHSSAHKS